MNKDVLVSINGTQVLDGDEDLVEVITHGQYYFKNEKHYITYEEVFEEYSEPIKNIIKISSDTVEVTKKGAMSTKMIFEKNKKNISCYETEVGSLMLSFNAKNIHINSNEDKIYVQIEYALEMNNEHVSDCVLTMNIESKETVREINLQ